MKNAMVFMALVLFLAACAAPSTPTLAPTSADTPVPTAAPTDTPQPTPSFTPAPCNTPEPTLSPTPTFLFFLPSKTPTPQTPGPTPSELDCQLISQSIPNLTHFYPKEHFDMGWYVRNTGTSGWSPGAVYFAFYAGSGSYQSPTTQLKTGVAPGETTELLADMVAPKGSGKYTVLWNLRRGSDYFCRVGLTYYVP